MDNLDIAHTGLREDVVSVHDCLKVWSDGLALEQGSVETESVYYWNDVFISQGVCIFGNSLD